MKQMSHSEAEKSAMLPKSAHKNERTAKKTFIDRVCVFFTSLIWVILLSFQVFFIYSLLLFVRLTDFGYFWVVAR